jgi:hypothetical protein
MGWVTWVVGGETGCKNFGTNGLEHLLLSCRDQPSMLWSWIGRSIQAAVRGSEVDEASTPAHGLENLSDTSLCQGRSLHLVIWDPWSTFRPQLRLK